MLPSEFDLSPPPVATPAIAYATADLTPQRGRQWCAAISLLLALASLLVCGLFGLAQGAGVWAVQRSIAMGPARVAMFKQQQAIMQKNAAAATAWLNRQSTNPPPLPSDAEVDGLIANLFSNESALNPAQLQTLRQELQKPGEQLFDPTVPYRTPNGSSTAPSGSYQSINLRPLAGGGVAIYFLHQEPFGMARSTTLRLKADGSVLDQRVDNGAANIVSTASLVALSASSTSSYNASLNLRRWRAVIPLTMTTLNFALAIGLLMAAIAAMRNRPSWIRLHRQYAVAKLVMVGLTGLTLYWAYGVFVQHEPYLAVIGVYVLSAALYPLSLLMRLR